ncbi:MAG: UDP-3-O-acyl-N-acetylglucosamine deacetylase [Polyangiaceae bacterium]
MELSGIGLFGGKACTVRLRRVPGPSGFEWQPEGARGALSFVPLSELSAEASLLSTRVSRGTFRLQTVEHCFAALAAFGAYEGLRLEVSGTEMPLLDGTARLWSQALVDLGFSPSPPPFRIDAPFDYEVGGSRYSFRPSDRVKVTCALRTDDLRLATEASWSGDALDFHERIAGARTFAFARDLENYARLGASAHVDPSNVIVVGDTIHCAGRPFEPDEPVRHKLLDLIGDMFAHGGPPIGDVHVIAPGHSRTHAALDFGKATAKIRKR